MLAALPLLLAALLTGCGGMLFEIVCVRRAAVVLGQGSSGLALVIGAFLVGLGAGARLLGASGAGGGRRLCLLYLLLAVTIPASPLLLGSLPGCLLIAFAAAFLMGGALPRLFALVGARHGGAGLVQGTNLLGSVLGCAAAVWCVPLLGLGPTAALAAACYGAAALLSLAAWRTVSETAGAAVSNGWLTAGERGLMAASGMTVIGLEIWLPRRLVFFTGGFLPTLSGALLAALLGLALGSYAAEFCERWGKRPRPSWVAAAGGVGAALAVALLELAGPAVAEWRLDGTPAALLAAVSLALLATLPAFATIGMLLPLVVSRLGAGAEHVRRRAADAFLWQAVGSLFGALMLPRAFDLSAGLRWLPGLAALPLAACCGWRGVLVLVAIAGGAVPFLSRPILEGARHFGAGAGSRQVVATASDHFTTASVVDDRVAADRLLYTDEFTAAGGAASGYMHALGLLPVWFAPEPGQLAVLCLGTGTTAAAVARAAAGRPLCVIEISPAVIALSSQFVAPHAAWSSHPALEVEVADGRRWLATREPGSLAALTLEPLLPQAPGSVHLYSREFYAAARRALVTGGICVQWVPAHAVPAPTFRSLVHTFVAAWPGARGFLVDNSLLLVGATDGRPEPRRAPVSGQDAHACGLWRDVDLALAEVDLTSLAGDAGAAVVGDDRPFLELSMHAPPVEVVGWLGGNLAALAPSIGPAIAAASELRLRGRRLLAESVLQPSRLDLAVDCLEKARLLAPDSTLLQRELRVARGARARAGALVDLAQARFADALGGFETALELGDATPAVLAGRAAALAWLGRDEAARQAVTDLTSLVPGFRDLESIAQRRPHGFEPLWQPALRAIEARRAPPIREADFVARWQQREPPALLWRRQRPVLARWLLLETLARGEELDLTRLVQDLTDIDTADLDRLEALQRQATGDRAEALRALAAALAARLRRS